MDEMQEQFERWYSDDGAWPKAVEKNANGNYKYIGAASAWDAWRASYKSGRESMREEIIPIVYGMCESDNVAARTVEAIRKIEA